MSQTGTSVHSRKRRDDHDTSNAHGVRSSSDTGRHRSIGSSRIATTVHTDGGHGGRRDSSASNTRLSTKSTLSSLLSGASGASKDAILKKDDPRDALRIVSDHVSLREARDWVNTMMGFVGQKFIHPLFAKTIIPATKYEMLREVRAALIDVVKCEKDMEEIEESNRRNQLANDRQKSLDKLRAAHTRLSDSHGDNFGASYHHTRLDEIRGNEDFGRFSEQIVDYVQKSARLEDIIDVLGIVNRACVALKDWSDRYDWEGIRKVKEDLGAYEEYWVKDRLFSGRGYDRAEVKKDELEEAKKALITINERAQRLKAQGKQQKDKRLKKPDAENRLSKAMKEMNALWEARQPTRSRKWYKTPPTGECAQQ